MPIAKGMGPQGASKTQRELAVFGSTLVLVTLTISSCSDEFSNCKETRTCPLPAESGGEGGDQAGEAFGASTSGGEAGGTTEVGASGAVGDGGTPGSAGSGPATCDAPYLDCDGSGECATDGASDKAHCGDCQTQCFQQCRGGVCADPIRISVGLTHACALLSDGSVWCWGSNFWGELGPGHPDGATAPVRISLPQEAIAVQAAGLVEAGGDPLAVSCAVLKDETIRCWGAGKFGGLGNGLLVDSPEPVEVKGVANVTELSHRGGQGCAVTGLGKLYCWGLNADGQVGDGTTTNVAAPVVVLTGISQVSCGGRHTCARKSNGDLYCWGSPTSGRLGIANPPDDTSLPIVVPGASDVDQFDAGSNHTLMQRGGVTYGWGSDYAGAVNATFSHVETPLKIDINGNPPPAKRVLAGADVSAVIGLDDTLTVWGNALLIHRDSSNGYAPVKIDVGAVIDASLGHGFADAQTICVIKSNHELSCWGADTYGQAGDGDPVAEVKTPTPIKFAN